MRFPAVRVGPSGRVLGVDFTDQQVLKATRLRDAASLQHVKFIEATIEALPFADGSFDVVL
ncbi:MAG: methyltransferase domain-containing protein [Solirubrobacteraceae bacterium]